MEVWERKHIQDNLPGLLQTTSCGEVFLSILRQKEILTTEEISQIKSSGTGVSNAKKLYEILETRIGAFDILINALKETRQTGAFKILNTFYKESTLSSLTAELVFDKKDLLGTGCNLTKVYKGRFSRREVAVKVINSDYVKPEDALKEIEFLIKCDWHPNIVRHFTAQTKDDFILIALELCDTNLEEWIKSCTGRAAEVELDILKQATRGLAHLHSLNIVHRDIKPENILITKTNDESFRVKISDFGLSREVLDGKSSFTFHTASGIGTQHWMAPEMLSLFSKPVTPKPSMTFAMDVFSLGCVFYYVVSNGCHPFGDDRVRIPSIVLDGTPLLDHKNLKVTTYDSIILINSMIMHEPKARPSCNTVLSHPCFWSKARILQFLANIASLVQSSSDKFSTAVQNLKSANTIVFGGSNVSWVDFTCNDVWEYISKQHISGTNSIISLIEFVNSISLKFESLPDNVKSAFGNTQTNVISYFSRRFPLFTSVVWMSFQCCKQEPILQEYYHAADYTFDLEFNVELISNCTKSCRAMHYRYKPTVNTKPTSYAHATIMQSFVYVQTTESDGDSGTSKIVPLSELWSTNSVAHATEPKVIAFCAKVEEKFSQDKTIMHRLHKLNNFNPARVDRFLKAVRARMSWFLLQPYDSQGCLPLHYWVGDLELLPTSFEIIKDAHLNFNAVDGHGNSLLFHAVKGGRSVSILIELIQLGVDLFHKNTYDETLLHFAARFGHKQAVQYLVFHGFPVNHQSFGGCTALYEAASSKQPNASDIMVFLLDNMANPNLFPDGERSPLSLVVDLPLKLYSLRLVKRLLQSGALINSKDKKGKTFLYHAAGSLNESSFLELVTYLCDCEKGAALVGPPDSKGTPVHRAISRFDLSKHTMEMIVNAGYDINKTNSWGKTLLHIALSHRRNICCLNNLLNLNANIYAVDANGHTPLQIAQNEGYDEAVKLLLQKRDLENANRPPKSQTKDTKKTINVDLFNSQCAISSENK